MKYVKVEAVIPEDLLTELRDGHDEAKTRQPEAIAVVQQLADLQGWTLESLLLGLDLQNAVENPQEPSDPRR